MKIRLWLEDRQVASKSQILGYRHLVIPEYQPYVRDEICLAISMSLMTKLVLILTLTDLHGAQTDPLLQKHFRGGIGNFKI